MSPDTHSETMQWLQAMGFRINSEAVRYETLEAVVDYHARWGEARFEKNYQTDGVVVKIDRLDYQRHLGSGLPIQRATSL